MLRQIRYFQAIVKYNSFSQAAVECYISQSAISQQIKALEHELGFSLFERHNRKFTLTKAGEYFYKKSLILLADFEQIHTTARNIASGNEATLKIGYLRNQNNYELSLALDDFSMLMPKVKIQLTQGNHEELFELLRTDKVDLLISDQRRAFSDEYINLILASSAMYIKISKRNVMATMQAITASELKSIPCIIVSSKEQQNIEKEFYQTILGIQSDIIYAQSMEEANLLVISDQGFLIEDRISLQSSTSTCVIPFYQDNKQLTYNLCFFYKKSNINSYIKEFADLMYSKFRIR